MSGNPDIPDPRRIHASPTKDFFVNMITRDISLQDCIFDLLDNSIDGARRAANVTKSDYLAGHWAQLSFDRERFRIVDNCGGISLSNAVDYAFHFGRQAGSQLDVAGGIGLYGIGMKRAVFKIGSEAEISSETARDSFKVHIDVEKWLRDDKDWDFRYDDEPRIGRNGTRVEVRRIHPEISVSLGDPSFGNELIRRIASDYAFFIARGFEISVNGVSVPSFRYDVRSSSDFAPAVETYDDDGVSVRIAAGFIDDLSDEVPDEVKPDEVERFGWYVVCNDRIVLNADKGNRSVWGDDNFRTWHPQYNGFAGFAFFNASDQRRLPWTTTKRDLDLGNPVYRRAVVKMKALTDVFVKYTNARKASLDEAKDVESKAGHLPVYLLDANRQAAFPRFIQALKPDSVTISYPKPRRELDLIRKHLGRASMTAKDIGIFTYDYYKSSEIEE